MMKWPMMLLWKAVVLELGVHGLQAHPQKFWFAEYLSKSPDSPGKNGAKRCLTSQGGAQVCIKKHEDLISEVTRKRGLHDLCGRKFAGCTKNFSGKSWEIRAKSFAPPKFACSYIYDEKAPPLPLPLFWKGGRGNALAMTPFSGIPVHIILRALFTRCCRLQCVTAMNMNYSGLLRRISSWPQ